MIDWATKEEMFVFLFFMFAVFGAFVFSLFVLYWLYLITSWLYIQIRYSFRLWRIKRSFRKLISKS